MAAKLGLATPSLEINDELVEYKPNSIEFKDGNGDITVRHQTGGGPQGSKIITKNAETQVGMVKFVLLAEATNVARIRSWLLLSEQANGNVIRLSDQGFTRTFRNMRLTEEPTNALGSEGESELMFEGDSTI